MQTLGGSVTARGLLPAALPPWLQALTARIARDTCAWGEGAEANHVLVNAYEPGDGIQVLFSSRPLFGPRAATRSGAEVFADLIGLQRILA